jgi:hypothetical protein
MPRTLLLGLIALAMAAGCGSGRDRAVLPTAIKQPPGMDAQRARKGIPLKGSKAPDAVRQSSADR